MNVASISIAICLILSSLASLILKAECQVLHPPIQVTPVTSIMSAYPSPSSSRRRAPLKRARSAYGRQPADGYSFSETHAEGGGGEQEEQEGDGDYAEEETSTQMVPRKSSFSSCLFKYIPSSCKASDMCGTRKLCVQITGDPCCASPQGECPTPIQLNIRCIKGNPINWCHHHIDCSRKALCCDSGCGYNVCVEQQEI